MDKTPQQRIVGDLIDLGRYPDMVFPKTYEEILEPAKQLYCEEGSCIYDQIMKKCIKEIEAKWDSEIASEAIKE